MTRTALKLALLALSSPLSGCRTSPTAPDEAGLRSLPEPAAQAVAGIDAETALPLIAKYCGGCHAPGAGHAFALGTPEASRQAIIANLPEIKARLARFEAAGSEVGDFMPPAGHAAYPNHPAVQASAEYTQLAANPRDFRRLIDSLFGKDGARKAIVDGTIDDLCAGCHNSSTLAAAGLQFYPDVGGTDEPQKRLFAKRPLVEAVLKNKMMPPPNSISALTLPRTPYMWLQAVAVFMPDE